MFFDHNRSHFFRPLTGKYRAQIVECLCELYQRQYSSSNADYGQALQRDTLIEIFQEALVRAPLLADEVGQDVVAVDATAIPSITSSGTGSITDKADSVEPNEGRFRSSRDHASWVLNQLIEFGWIEKQVDEASLQSTFAFTRYGRQFTEPFLENQQGTSRTRHRNTRNTRNSLESFLERGDIYDLLDAYEYSERIISDFTDVIAELEERKRDLVREMEDQLLIQRASDAFFDFMENRFQPDLAVRLSADNVEKHRDQIQTLVQKIRKKDVAFKAATERRLRELLPDMIAPGQSVMWHILDGIELRLRNASDIMLPSLRRALQSFTKRADIIIRQMSYLASQQQNSVVDLCKQLQQLPAEQQAAVLEQAAEKMAVPSIELIDPAQVKLAAPRQRRQIDAVLNDDMGALDIDARKETYVQQVLDQAFLVNQQSLRQYVSQQMISGEKVSTRHMPINTAQDFLAVAHAIGLGAADGLSSEFQFVVEPDTGTDAEAAKDSGYFIQKDHFTFQLIEKES